MKATVGAKAHWAKRHLILPHLRLSQQDVAGCSHHLFSLQSQLPSPVKVLLLSFLTKPYSKPNPTGCSYIGDLEWTMKFLAQAQIKKERGKLEWKEMDSPTFTIVTQTEKVWIFLWITSAENTLESDLLMDSIVGGKLTPFKRLFSSIINNKWMKYQWSSNWTNCNFSQVKKKQEDDHFGCNSFSHTDLTRPELVD